VSRPGRALFPGKGPSVPIVQEAGWAPQPVWTQRLEEKALATDRDVSKEYRSKIQTDCKLLLTSSVSEHNKYGQTESHAHVVINLSLVIE
jgi:hypothetical protein